MISMAVVVTKYSENSLRWQAGGTDTDPAAIVSQFGGDIIGKLSGSDIYVPKAAIAALEYMTAPDSGEKPEDTWCVSEEASEPGGE